MPEKVEAKIILRRIPLGMGKVEISVYDTVKDHEIKTGLKAGPGQAAIDREVFKLKETLERAGSRVTVKEMG